MSPTFIFPFQSRYERVSGTMNHTGNKTDEYTSVLVLSRQRQQMFGTLSPQIDETAALP